MHASSPSKIIFLVGIGASIDLYQPFLTQLSSHFPQTKIEKLNWWQQSDLGMKYLEHSLQKESAMLIGHSAGGMISLKALQQWPQQIKKIIMLDSHIVHHINKLPSIEKMLEIMLDGDIPEIKQHVEAAYQPIKQNDKQFYRAFTTLVDWVNSDFEKIASQLELSYPSRVMHIGFTDANYKKYDNNGTTTEKELWGKYAIATQCMPMNHFDLLDNQKAKKIIEIISKWCQ